MQGLAQNDLRHLLSRKSGGAQQEQPEARSLEQRPSLTSRLGTVTRSEPEPRVKPQRSERSERAPRRIVEIETQQPRMARQPSRNR